MFTPLIDSIIFGGDEYAIVKKGNKQISSGGRDFLFLNVHFIPIIELGFLLVSQVMLHSPQLGVIFSLHKCNIVDRESHILQLVLRIMVFSNFLIQVILKSKSWQPKVLLQSIFGIKRYGHLNIPYLSQLTEESLVVELPKIQSQNHSVCGACQQGKQLWTMFSNGDSWRASKVLQLVHVDICGP